VPHCPLLHFPPLPHRAELSTPAMSTPANSAFPCYGCYCISITVFYSITRSCCITYCINLTQLLEVYAEYVIYWSNTLSLPPVVLFISFITAHTWFFFPFALIICPIAIAQHGTDYKITCVCLSVSKSVCHHSYCRNFYSIFMTFLFNFYDIFSQWFGGWKVRSSLFVVEIRWPLPLFCLNVLPQQCILNGKVLIPP